MAAPVWKILDTTSYMQKWYEVLTTALLKFQSSGIYCPRRLEASTYTSPILFQTQQNPRYIHKTEMEKRLYTRPRAGRLQTLYEYSCNVLQRFRRRKLHVVCTSNRIHTLNLRTIQLSPFSNAAATYKPVRSFYLVVTEDSSSPHFSPDQ
jgi:hypothetical protein